MFHFVMLHYSECLCNSKPSGVCAVWFDFFSTAYMLRRLYGKNQTILYKGSCIMELVAKCLLVPLATEEQVKLHVLTPLVDKTGLVYAWCNG